MKRIITNLCVMDFGGPDNTVRVVSLHPGVTFAEVQDNTGFELIDSVEGETALPTGEQLTIVAKLDPHGIRHKVLADNPPAIRGQEGEAA